jgi:hypothetical protein
LGDSKQHTKGKRNFEDTKKIYPNHQDERYVYHSDLSRYVSDCTVCNVAELFNFYSSAYIELHVHVAMDIQHTIVYMLCIAINTTRTVHFVVLLVGNIIHLYIARKKSTINCSKQHVIYSSLLTLFSSTFNVFS